MSRRAKEGWSEAACQAALLGAVVFLVWAFTAIISLLEGVFYYIFSIGGPFYG